ncbi:hypothetical protein BTM25_16280 [Actinomadura rubteroloni]|uniref:Uncharacterized protein n=1 Tax=Actinomadura rubteroloni TaxID=1926885 RepID=A0A2P4UQ87_9ACTN|nr:hypothetical protein [Actinomadura rubteroloni]POM27217.1 hypothetical protein BTM25_16280 [Actinomadura rubteroloni]
MNGIIARRRGTKITWDDLRDVRPLPVWFFGFEGLMAGAFDLCKAWHGAWALLLALAAVNVIVGLTVLRRRIKLVRAMLRDSRTRKIAVVLIAARIALHAALAALGLQITTPAAHLALAAVMTTTTITLLWLDQRVTFRALARTA